MTERLGHCSPVWGGHSPACDRDGAFCALASSHAGPCRPHGAPVELPPRCDLCGGLELRDLIGSDVPAEMVDDWNGETGNHLSCEAVALRREYGIPTYVAITGEKESPR